MRLRPFCTLLAVAGLLGCGTTLQTVTTNPPQNTTHTYNGTASVGDFLTITVDASALTIKYTDVSNGESGTVPYTVNGDGSYTINDPSGNLIAAYEVPNYALVIEATQTGPMKNAPALITGRGE